jgi:AbrB family looped-hinge helix DNA binding protein
MTFTVQNKTELIVPRSVRRKAGIKAGDQLEFRVSGGIINIVPKLPSADDEYTPAQRRVVDREIAKGLQDIKKGRVHGPFATADEAIASLKRLASARGRTARNKAVR